MSRKWLLVAVCLVALAVAACGGGGATNTNSGSLSLNETYTGDGISLKYPNGWVISPEAAEGGPISLANSQAALDVATSETVTKVESGQQMIIVLPFPADIAAAMSVTSPLNLLQQIVPSISADDGGLSLTFGDPGETTIGGKAAARASGTGEGGDGEVIAVDLGDVGYIIVMGATGKGEMNNLVGTLNAVAESVNITAAAG